MEKALRTINQDDAAVPTGDRSLPIEVREPNTLICLMGEQTHPCLILAGKLQRSLKNVILLGTADVGPLVVHAGAAVSRLVRGVTVEVDTSLPSYDWRETEALVQKWVNRRPGAVLDLTGGLAALVIRPGQGIL